MKNVILLLPNYEVKYKVFFEILESFQYCLHLRKIKSSVILLNQK